MSASTRTIQRPMGQGSIFGAVAVGAAALLAVGAIAWGTLNLTTTKHAGTSVQAPALLDKGSRFDVAAPAATYVQGKLGNVTPRFDAGQAKPAPIYVLPGSQVSVPGFLQSQAAPIGNGHGYMSAAAAAARNAGITPTQVLDRNADGNVVVIRGRGARAS